MTRWYVGSLVTSSLVVTLPSSLSTSVSTSLRASVLVAVGRVPAARCPARSMSFAFQFLATAQPHPDHHFGGEGGVRRAEVGVGSLVPTTVPKSDSSGGARPWPSRRAPADGLQTDEYSTAVADVPIFEWPLADEFLDRAEELQRLEQWWASRERMPVNLHGRRRVGKSWLFRRFAHGKPAVLLVASRVYPGAQLSSFAARLEPLLGVRPDLPDMPTLFRVLFRAARKQKLLAVIDEFPWLLPTSGAGVEAELSAIQAVMEEERDDSQLKLVLCGSQVGQMEALQSERSPLHGRLVPLRLRRLPFREARLFLPELDPLAAFERFAVSGGMPRYLAALAGPSVKKAVCSAVLDRNSALYDEARTIVEQELREPKSYFAVLTQLADGDKEFNEIAQGSRLTAATVSKYLGTLADLKLVQRVLPAGAAPDSRQGHWRLQDPFIRFWFRYVFPFQDELESGLSATDLFDGVVAPTLNDHVAPVFEEWCRDYTRTTHGKQAQSVAAWWGMSTHALRRTGERSSEEIDVVGLSRGRVTVLGEAKWQNKPMDVATLRNLRQYKVPALEQAGFKMSSSPITLLFSKSGYSPALQRAAAAEGAILVDVREALSG